MDDGCEHNWVENRDKILRRYIKKIFKIQNVKKN